MRRFLPALCLLSLLAALPVAAQQDFSKVEITVTPLATGLAMLQGSGGNLAASYGDDGVFLIDDQYAPLTDKIRAAVATLSAKPIRFVLNTHWHGDHTGGNENFGKAGTLIVAHDNVRGRMAVEHVSQVWSRTIPASPAAALPVVTFNDTTSFHLNGETIHAYHVPPAHTDGDSVVWFKKADVVHMGDLFFNGLYPFIDGESGGSIDGVIAAANRVLGEVGPATKIIPGHGPLAGKAELAAYRDMLIGVRANVAALIAAGKSVDEVIAAKPTAAWDEVWGKGFFNPDTFTRVVYTLLSQHHH